MPVNTVLEGPLSKWTNMLSGWQYRWFVLDPLNGLLSYYTSKENMSKGERRGCIRLNKAPAYVGYDNEDDITFTITVDDKTFHLQARNLDEREKWVNKIDRTIRYHASSASGKDKSQLLSDDGMGGSSSNELFESSDGLSSFDMAKFDAELTESDAYLQLLIEQLKGLEMKRMRLLQTSSTVSASSSTTGVVTSSLENTTAAAAAKVSSQDLSILDPNLNSYDGNYSDSLLNAAAAAAIDVESYSIADDEKFQSIISATESLIETLKHAIICLQIAKANTDPESNVGELANDLSEVISNFNKTQQSQPHFSLSDSLPRQNESKSSPVTSSQSSSKAIDNNVKKHLQTLKEEPSTLQQQQQKKADDKGGNKTSTSTTMTTATASGTSSSTTTSKGGEPMRKSLTVISPMKSYSSSDDEEKEKSNNKHKSVSTSKLTSPEQSSTLLTSGGEISGSNTVLHKNIIDDDDDEENLSDYFNDDDDDVDEDDDDEISYERRNNKNRVADDNDSESFYDAIDPTVTVTSYSSITTTTTTAANQELLNRILSGVDDTPSAAPSQSSANDSRAVAELNSQPSVEHHHNHHHHHHNQQSTAITDVTALSQSDLSARGLIVIDHKLVSDSDLYDDDAIPEDVDLNNEQSVITHLLTQVRIGMDLTKITLPTFILEPRSLLEMYADFFAHTDLFLEIVEKKNAHDRMIQVMKWYLSTLHAGRKSPVAKKPYNPILGEIFQCWYSVPQLEQSANSDRTLVSDGPVTWSTRDQLSFIAEQVSHHPPISAFYAEHFNKRIQIDGYTWTKSKFLGLSIGVQFVGKAVLSLLDFDEEYVLTFPSAYGRSILTVPWFEMGGQVSVSCAKTGYSSNIEFLTKPFYGGKKHQIQGTIMGPDKKALYTIDGDWNGTMFIKGTKKEVLIATQSTPTIRKLVRPLADQTDNESRRLWREVTYFLRTKQIDRATSAKQKIEHYQREMVKHRKETNTKWQPQYFVEDGENWVYVNPLVRRLNN